MSRYNLGLIVRVMFGNCAKIVRAVWAIQTTRAISHDYLFMITYPALMQGYFQCQHHIFSLKRNFGAFLRISSNTFALIHLEDFRLLKYFSIILFIFILLIVLL